MSLCRWSTDNYACDLYVYEDVRAGWTIHVAGNRIVGDIPKLPPLNGDRSPEAIERWNLAYVAQCAFLDSCDWEPIGLPFDGETFREPSRDHLVERLLALRSAGYHFPDNVLDQARGGLPVTPSTQAVAR